jgi:hypothetical protein
VGIKEARPQAARLGVPELKLHSVDVNFSQSCFACLCRQSLGGTKNVVIELMGLVLVECFEV